MLPARRVVKSRRAGSELRRPLAYGRFVTSTWQTTLASAGTCSQPATFSGSSLKDLEPRESIALLPSADRLVQSLQLLVGVEVDHESAATPSTIELDLGPQRLAEPLLQGSNVRALEPPLPGPRPREAHLFLAPDLWPLIPDPWPLAAGP